MLLDATSAMFRDPAETGHLFATDTAKLRSGGPDIEHVVKGETQD